MAKFQKDELREKGSVKSEKSEGLKKINQELKNGTEKHVTSAKKAKKLLKKGK